MNYFVSKRDLDEMRDNMFTAIARALYELEHKVSLLINVGYAKRDPARIRKGVKEMDEVKDLMAKLKTVSEGKENEELQDIVLRLETALGKHDERWKDYNKQLQNLIKRIKILEGKEEKKAEKGTD